MPLGHRPETAYGTQIWRPNTGQDPAKYLIPDDFLRHGRPSISSGDNVFTFPIGVEGFRRSGQALLARHYYIGDNDVDVQVVHLDEARIELSGVFPGLTAVDNMIELSNLLTSPSPDRGKILFMPGIFERMQYVNIENYNFDHEAGDQTHSINYTISFLRTGLGKKIRDPHGQPPIPNPSVHTTVRGANTHRTKTVRDGQRTLRQLAKMAYGTAQLWARILILNKTPLEKKLKNVPRHKWPNYRLPLGMKLKV